MQEAAGITWLGTDASAAFEHKSPAAELTLKLFCG
jgi:hypothetical protein